MNEHAQIRKGDWMQTFTGRQFWPMDPRPEEVFIEDIAHGLAMQCRYAGHCLRFYSVAEHSVLMSRYVTDAFKVWALLHDASEAYLTDVIRPVKPSLPGYRAAEDALMVTICERFGLDYIANPFAMPSAVKEADNRILHDEKQQNMSACAAPWHLAGEPLGIELQFWTPEQAEAEFLSTFHSLFAA